MKNKKTIFATLLLAFSLLLSGAGAWAWQRNIGPGWASAVAVDGAGNVAVAGATRNSEVGSDFAVAKFDGMSGKELWRQVRNGTGGGWDQANAIAVDTAGNVVAAGYTVNTGTTSDFTVIKFDGATGAELWRKLIADGSARSVTLDAAGDVVAAGWIGSETAVVKFDGVNGAELWRTGMRGTAGWGGQCSRRGWRGQRRGGRRDL